MEVKKKTKALISSLRNLVPKVSDFATKTPSQIEAEIQNTRNKCEEVLLSLRNDVTEEKSGFIANESVTIAGEQGEFTFVGVCSESSAVCRKGNAWDVYSISDIAKVAPVAKP
jgi:hypothetical protein